MSTPIPIEQRKAEKGGTVYVVGTNGKAYAYTVQLVWEDGRIYASSLITREGHTLERLGYLLPHEVTDRGLETVSPESVLGSRRKRRSRRI